MGTLASSWFIHQLISMEKWAMIFTLSMIGNIINGDDEDDDPIVPPNWYYIEKNYSDFPIY